MSCNCDDVTEPITSSLKKSKKTIDKLNDNWRMKYDV
mgnify:CR=1 FL=1